MGKDVRPALLTTLLALTPSPLYVVDEALRVVWSRDGEATGRGLTELYDVDGPEDVTQQLRQVLLAEPAEDAAKPTTFRGRNPDAARSDLRFTAHRLAPQAGAPALLVVVEDQTRRDRSRTQHAALAAVREHVGRSLDLTRTCRDLAEALVPGFADIAVVDVVDDVLRGAEPPESPVGPGTPLRCAAVRLADAGMELPCREGASRGVSLRTPQARALSDLEPRLVPVDGASAWLSASPEHAEAIQATGAHSLLLVPLALRGAVLGVLSLYRCGSSPAYHSSDVATGENLAAHAALSMDNARRYARDHTIASTVQRHLLPQRATRTPALETAHAYLPGRNSGCWFDAIALPGGRTALVVGKVAGQGIETAATMGQLRMVINALADLDLEPAELLARLEGTATRLALERDAAPGTGSAAGARGGGGRPQPLLASCLYGVFDPFSRTCVVAGAGELAPLVVDPDGRVSAPDLPPGPPLGSGEPLPHAEVEIELPEGGVLVFRTGAFAAGPRWGGEGTATAAYDPAADYDPVAAYGLDGVDGISGGAGGPAGDRARERRPGGTDGGDAAGGTEADPVRDALARPGQSLREMCDAAVYALPPDGERDGAVLLLARAERLPDGHAATVDLPDGPEASAEARTAARRVLAGWHADGDTVEAAELIVSELVTNAVRYGAPPVRLRLLHADGRLTCEVHDTGTAAPHLRHARTADEGGRGLFIVSQLADRWGARHTAAGKILWTELGRSGDG